MYFWIIPVYLGEGFITLTVMGFFCLLSSNQNITLNSKVITNIVSTVIKYYTVSNSINEPVWYKYGTNIWSTCMYGGGNSSWQLLDHLPRENHEAEHFCKKMDSFCTSMVKGSPSGEG